MTPQLFSIEHAPASLPIWHTVMDDLARPPARRVARVLGIGVRTVYRYNKTGSAPRVVLLALFWLTRWGRSAVNVQAVNDATLAVSYVRSLCDRIAQLEHQVGHLQRLGGYGSANLPLVDPGDRGGTPQVVSPRPSDHPAERSTRGFDGPSRRSSGAPATSVAARPDSSSGLDALDTPHDSEGRGVVGRRTGDAAGTPGRRPAAHRPAQPGGRRRRPA